MLPVAKWPSQRPYRSTMFLSSPVVVPDLCPLLGGRERRDRGDRITGQERGEQGREERHDEQHHDKLNHSPHDGMHVP